MPKIRYEVEIDRISMEEWSASLGLFEDASIYQTWSYGAIRWGEQNASHLILKREGAIVAMAQLRIVRPAGLKFGIAHLRWGPVCHLEKSELILATVERVAAALYEEYVRKRGLFLRILPHALLGSPRAEMFQSAFRKFRRETFGPADSFRTFVVDLSPTLEVIRKRLDQKWRNQLNRAERNGLTVHEDDGPGGFRTFAPIFDEMWNRKKFSGSSDIQEFTRIQEDLPPGQRMKVFICEFEGKPVAGLVGTAAGNTGIYLFGATNDAGMKSKGAYLLQWRMIQWLKEIGVRHYNLGGINPQTNPGVYHFKKGMSGEDVLYMQPFVACDRVASRACAWAAGLAHGRVRRVLNSLLGRP